MKISQAAQQTNALLASLEQQHGSRRITLNDVPPEQQELVKAATGGASSFTVDDVRHGVLDGFDALKKADGGGFLFRGGRNNGVLETTEVANAARRSPVASPLYTLIGARVAARAGETKLTMEAAANLPTLTGLQGAIPLRALAKQLGACTSMSEALDLLRGSPDLLRVMKDGGRYAVAHRLTQELPTFSDRLKDTAVRELVLERRGATIEVYRVEEPITERSTNAFITGGVVVSKTYVTNGQGTLLPADGSKDTHANDFLPSDLKHIDFMTEQSSGVSALWANRHGA